MMIFGVIKKTSSFMQVLKYTKFTLHDIPIISNAGIFTNFQSDASVFFVSSEGGAVGNKDNSTLIHDLLNHICRLASD